MIMFCEGGHFTLLPNVLKKIYGEKGTQLYGILFSYTSLVSIILIVLQTYLLTDEARSYNVFFFTNGSLSVVSLFLLLFFFKEDKF